MKINKLKAFVLACSFMMATTAITNVEAAALSRKPQDNLFFAASSEPLGLDPALVDDSDSGNILANVYESLLKFKPGSTEVMPGLAERWDISDDGLVYTFYLRKGVKFHDGTPFNAEAVKFNFDRQSPENAVPKMSYAPLVLGDIAKSEVLDEYTFRVTLKQVSTPFLRNMAMCYSAPIASPTALKKFNNSLMDNPVGTGPYRFIAWDRGQQIVLTTFDDYWGEKPKIKNVIYRIIKETSARVVALNNGEIDVAIGIDGNVLDQIKAGGNQIFQEEANNVNMLVFNCRKNYVTADSEVRRALAQALNVPEMVQSLYKGVDLYATSYFPTFFSTYDPNLKPITYDPEQAKKVLAEKGVKKIKILTYTNVRMSNSVGGQVLAEAMQDYFKRVGVEASIDAYDWGTYKAKLLTDDWDLSFYGWAGDNGDPDNFINILAANDPIANQGLWLNQKFIDLIKKGARTPDGKERDEIYKEADRVIVEDAGVLPLTHPRSIVAYRSNIANAKTHPVGLFFFEDVEKK